MNPVLTKLDFKMATIYVYETYYSGCNPVHHHTLGQVHGVGDGKHDEASVGSGWPIKQVVHHRLLTGPQQVQLNCNKK